MARHVRLSPERVTELERFAEVARLKELLRIECARTEKLAGERDALLEAAKNFAAGFADLSELEAAIERVEKGKG